MSNEQWSGRELCLAPPSTSLFRCWRTLFSSILIRKHWLESKGGNSQIRGVGRMKTLLSYLLQMEGHYLLHLSSWAHTRALLWTASSPPKTKHTYYLITLAMACFLFSAGWGPSWVRRENVRCHTSCTYSLLWEMLSSVLSVFWGRCSCSYGNKTGFDLPKNGWFPMQWWHHWI